MSQLPQRKKSPEEIAKLRESLGVHGPSPETGAVAPQSPPQTPAPPAPAPEPAPEPQARRPKPVRSLKKSEQTPAGDIPTLAVDKPIHIDPAAAEGIPPNGPKPVRSLRKSEQGPIVLHEPPPDSKLPIHRHSDDEIQRIRRQEAMQMMQTAPNPKLLPAHPALIIPGYLAAAAAPALIYFQQIPAAAAAAIVAAALAVAAAVTVRKPVSRHHAAFIAIICLFTLVFGALHYFPHLRHAS